MRATIDVPDDLYRRVKAKSALQGRTVRDVTEGLYRTWLADDETAPSPESSAAWMSEWIRMGRDALADRPEGSTTSEQINQARGRMDESYAVPALDAND